MGTIEMTIALTLAVNDQIARAPRGVLHAFGFAVESMPDFVGMEDICAAIFKRDEFSAATGWAVALSPLPSGDIKHVISGTILVPE